VRDGRCRDCHATYMRSYRRSRREWALNDFARQAKWRSEPVLTAICEAMIGRFGGFDKFVREWHQQMLEMTGTKSAIDSYLAIMRLVEMAAKRQCER